MSGMESFHIVNYLSIFSYLKNDKFLVKYFLICTSTVCHIGKIMKLWRINFLLEREKKLTNIYSFILTNLSDDETKGPHKAF